MKIVTLLGSPRPNANSSAIAGHLTEAAAKLGAETKTYQLNKMNYRGCQGCYACKTTLDHCGLNDDLTEVLDAVAKADAVVLASPVYYGDVTAQLKGYIDRNYAYLTPDYRTSATPSRLASKKLVVVLTQGNPDEKNFADIFPKYEMFMKWMGFTETHLIRTCGIGPEDKPAESILKQAEAAARALVAHQ